MPVGLDPALPPTAEPAPAPGVKFAESDEVVRAMPIGWDGPAAVPEPGGAEAIEGPLEDDGEGDLDFESLDFVRERFCVSVWNCPRWKSLCSRRQGWESRVDDQAPVIR